MLVHKTDSGSANPFPSPTRLAANYLRTAKLFNMSGRWPWPRAERQRLYNSASERSKLRKDWGSWDRPPEPPSWLRPEQVAEVNALIESRGWTIVRGRAGWGLVRIGDF